MTENRFIKKHQIVSIRNKDLILILSANFEGGKQ
jgi:hypothetical protein